MEDGVQRRTLDMLNRLCLSTWMTFRFFPRAPLSMSCTYGRYCSASWRIRCLRKQRNANSMYPACLFHHRQEPVEHRSSHGFCRGRVACAYQPTAAVLPGFCQLLPEIHTQLQPHSQLSPPPPSPSSGAQGRISCSVSSYSGSVPLLSSSSLTAPRSSLWSWMPQTLGWEQCPIRQ